MDDRLYMLRCFEIAQKSQGHNLSNPMVGAIIVHQGRIIGEGFHKKYGGPHAEINALQSVFDEDKKILSESTLYVSLEPCSHFGKTPPCVDAIIHSGIRKVVIGTTDPNPLVSGKGISILQNSGIQVELSALQREAKDLIRPFTAHLQKRPYIILKCVKSKDHFIGKKGENIWLSNAQMKVISHIWRAETDAILVGKNTVLSDDPSLNVRHVEGKNPVRVVIDPDLQCTPDKKVYSEMGDVIVYNSKQVATDGNLTFVKFEPGSDFLNNVVHDLFSRGIYSLLVEGGAFTLQQFINTNLWDEARVVQTPQILNEGIRAPDIEGNLHIKKEIGDNTLFIIHNPKSFAIPHQEGL